MADIYRKSSLERIASPDQLDRMIVVTSPSFWLAMVGGALIVVAALIWSIVGRLPVLVEASGLYVGNDTAGQVVCYVPLESGKKITRGMEVILYPTTVNQQEVGHLEGTVVAVDDYVATTQEMQEQLGVDSLVDSFTQNGPVVGVVCSLRIDSDTQSGYYWSSSKGSSQTLALGTLMNAEFVVEKKAPISMVIPLLQEKLTLHIAREDVE